ncbi:phosphotransferase [Paenibacillus albidus]|uniref:phosphotransferase enzyme family protein n=1 Tax=Paenibacillus albidus TaxID=2041023 RepID=UPI001BE7EE81|nr:phosphotransferase [Paenibacillus albidus]MBT2291651.1 phosphotransferase [Paenibacillus albidus]
MEKLVKTSQEIYEDLQESCTKLFNLDFLNPRPLSLGWLNLKWRVESKEGQWVLKQFSKERYSGYDADKVLSEQKTALEEQQRQYKAGIPCARLLAHKGEVMHYSTGGERFVVMEYIAGEHVPAGTLNGQQMYNLGRTCARIHNVANDGHYVQSGPAATQIPSRSERIGYWKSLLDKARQTHILQLLNRQLTAACQWEDDLIAGCVQGWAHRDLWTDNLLFNGNELAAVLDFDRFAYDYPELDIARAVMSGAFNTEDLDRDAAAAFVEGYRTERDLPEGSLSRALYLLWSLESVWWIKAEMEGDRPQPLRFAREMDWLATNFTQLQQRFGDL